MNSKNLKALKEEDVHEDEEFKCNDRVNIAASSVGGFMMSPSPAPGFYDPMMHSSI